MAIVTPDSLARGVVDVRTDSDARRAGSLGWSVASRAMIDKPPPDPAKLLADWMEWERGETAPGKVMSNLKTGGLRDLLEQLAADAAG